MSVKSYTELREYRKKKNDEGYSGRHFLFENYVPASGITHYTINIEPYYGDEDREGSENPGVFFGAVKRQTGKTTNVGNWNPNVKKIVSLLDPSKAEDKIDVSKAPIASDSDTRDLKNRNKDQQMTFDFLNDPLTEYQYEQQNLHKKNERRAESIWTQGQVYCEDNSCYDVEKLQEITEDNVIQRIEVQKLKKQLFDNAWGEKGEILSPFDVMTNPDTNKENMRHMARIRSANLEKPIMIRVTDGKVIDGYHRLSRSFLEGHKKINSIVIQEEQMEKAKITEGK